MPDVIKVSKPTQSKKLALVVCFVSIMLLVCLFALFVNYTARLSNLKKAMGQTAVTISKAMSDEFETYTNLAKTLSTEGVILDDTISVDEKRVALEIWAEEHNVVRCNFLDVNGVGLDDNDYSDRPYFQAALRGDTFIAEPVVSKVTGKITQIVSAPVFKNDDIIGCVYIVPYEDFLSQLLADQLASSMKDYNIDACINAYVLNNEGYVMAAPDLEMVKQRDSLFGSIGNEGFEGILAKMGSGEAGSGNYECNGERMLASYSPVEGVNDWSLLVFSSQSDFISVDSVWKSNMIVVLIVLLLSNIVAISWFLRLQ